MSEEIRIQKFLSECGIMSRRKAEEEILKGRIEINGKKAEIGQKIIPDLDEIFYNGINIKKQTENKIYIMIYKPAGIVTTMSDEKGRPCIADILKDANIEERIYPIGRLDMYSEGLLLLTNDGELSNNLMHPKNEIEKTYHVTVKGELDGETIKKISYPIEIDGKKTKPAEADIIERKNNKTKLRIKIHEGRNRQIRRICENLDIVILKLKRIALGELNIDKLKPYEWRYLQKTEINYLKRL